MLSILFRKINIVALVLAVLVLFGCGERVEAADISAGPYVVNYEGVNFYFYLGDFEQPFGANNFDKYKVVFDNPENKVTFWCMESNGDVWNMVYDYTGAEFTCNYYMYTTSNQSPSAIPLTVKSPSFRGTYSQKYYADSSLFPEMTSNYKDLCIEFCNSDVFQTILNPPPDIDFSNYNKAEWLWLSDFKASLVDDVIYMTWGDLEGYLLTDQNTYEHRYIEFSALFVDDDAENASDKYFMPQYIYTDLADYEGTISYDDWQVPEGSRLLYLYAIPYWFYMDIPDGKISRGKMSMITFDADGSSGNPLIKDTDDIYNPLDPDFSNWNAITNFTGNYFNNMKQTFDNTFQNYDASGMDDNTDKLGGGLRRYQGEQDAIIDGVSANIEQFNPGDYLNFSEQIVFAMGMASGWINQFLDVSADFTTVFIVGCIMVVIFVVIGIWRFQ